VPVVPWHRASGGHTGRAGRAAPGGPRALGAPKEVVLKQIGTIRIIEVYNRTDSVTCHTILSL
jgi:hypothetical protein